MSDLKYSRLTGTVYIIKGNGQKEPVSEPSLAAVISGYLDDHTLRVRAADGAWVDYIAQPEAPNDGTGASDE